MSPEREGYPHLPADVEPGPQSQRGRSGRRFNIIYTPIFFVVFAFVAYSGFSDGGFGGDSVPVWFIVFAGGAVVFWLGGPLLGRALRLRGVTIEAQPARVRRGERVQATVRADRELGDIEVGLVLTVRHDDRVRSSNTNNTGSSTRRVTRSDTVVEHWVPATIGSFGTAVALDVPIGSPYSYEGTCVSFAWALSARRGRRTSAPQPVWVEP